MIGPKITRKIRQDMILNVSLGFQDLPDPKDKKRTYSLCVVDTVRVGPHGATPLSTEASKKKDDVMFYFQQRDEGKSKAKTNGSAPSAKAGASVTRNAKSTVMKSRLRNEGKDTDDAAAGQRKSHQDALAERKQKEGLERFGEGAGAIDAAKEKAWKKFESYREDKQLPDSAADQRVRLAADLCLCRSCRTDSCRRAEKHHHFAHQWICRALSHQYAQECGQARRVGRRVHDFALHVCHARSDCGQKGGYGASTFTSLDCS